MQQRGALVARIAETLHDAHAESRDDELVGQIVGGDHATLVAAARESDEPVDLPVPRRLAIAVHVQDQARPGEHGPAGDRAGLAVIAAVTVVIARLVAAGDAIDARDHAQPAGQPRACGEAEGPRAAVDGTSAVLPARRVLEADAALGRADVADGRVARGGRGRQPERLRHLERRDGPRLAQRAHQVARALAIG